MALKEKNKMERTEDTTTSDCLSEHRKYICEAIAFLARQQRREKIKNMVIET